RVTQSAVRPLRVGGKLMAISRRMQLSDDLAPGAPLGGQRARKAGPRNLPNRPHFPERASFRTSGLQGRNYRSRRLPARARIPRIIAGGGGFFRRWRSPSGGTSRRTL